MAAARESTAPAPPLDALRERPVVLVRRTRPLPVERVEVLRELIGRVARSVEWVDDVAYRPVPGTVVLFRGSPTWYGPTLGRIAAVEPQRRPCLVMWHTEPLPFSRASGLPPPRLHARELAKIALRDARVSDQLSNARALRGLAARGLLDVLAVSTAAGVEYLAEHGIAAGHVPLGWTPALGRDLGLERDLDVVFIGSLDVPRRRRILRGLRRAGVPVVALGGWSPSKRLQGEERTRVLNRAKILLNLPRQSGLLSGHRMLLGMGNRALVLSEPVHRPEPYVPGVHFASAPVDELPAAIGRLLANEEERTRIADAGHRFAIEELTLERSLARLLELVDARLRAAG